MVASAAARERVHTLRLPRSVASLWPIVLVAFTWMMLVVAVWLCIRHLAGKLQQPLSFAPLLAVGLVSAAAVSALRGGWWRIGLRPVRGWSLATALWLLPTLAALLLAAALSIRGTSTAALCALWGSLLLNELLWGRYGSRAPARRQHRFADGCPVVNGRIVDDRRPPSRTSGQAGGKSGGW